MGTNRSPEYPKIDNDYFLPIEHLAHLMGVLPPEEEISYEQIDVLRFRFLLYNAKINGQDFRTLMKWDEEKVKEIIKEEMVFDLGRDELSLSRRDRGEVASESKKSSGTETSALDPEALFSYSEEEKKEIGKFFELLDENLDGKNKDTRERITYKETFEEIKNLFEKLGREDFIRREEEELKLRREWEKNLRGEVEELKELKELGEGDLTGKLEEAKQKLAERVKEAEQYLKKVTKDALEKLRGYSVSLRQIPVDGVLGEYDFFSRKITIYPPMIELASKDLAGELKLDGKEQLISSSIHLIVECHEAAHAVSHLGLSRRQGRARAWEEKEYLSGTVELHEAIAQYYTKRVMASLTKRSTSTFRYVRDLLCNPYVQAVLGEKPSVEAVFAFMNEKQGFEYKIWKFFYFLKLTNKNKDKLSNLISFSSNHRLKNLGFRREAKFLMICSWIYKEILGRLDLLDTEYDSENFLHSLFDCRLSCLDHHLSYLYDGLLRDLLLLYVWGGDAASSYKLLRDLLLHSPSRLYHSRYLPEETSVKRLISFGLDVLFLISPLDSMPKEALQGLAEGLISLGTPITPPSFRFDIYRPPRTDPHGVGYIANASQKEQSQKRDSKDSTKVSKETQS